MERGRVIDQLIEIKTRQGGGSAFRPAREASMMRALVERHRGILPLDTVEGIWRVIISTFTYVQAPYSVHVDVSGGDAAMRNSARFHFGFTTPCAPHFGAGEVIRAVADSVGDLGMFAVDGGPGAGAWWTKLAPPEAPKIIARLPFVERADHPAGMPVFVISKPLVDGTARDVVLESVTLDRWRPDIPHALRKIGAEAIGSAANGMGLALLVARPGEIAPDAASEALRSAGAADVRSSEIGAHADRIRRLGVAQAARIEANRTRHDLRCSRPPSASGGNSGNRPLCARQEPGPGRGQGSQALIQRIAPRPLAEGDRSGAGAGRQPRALSRRRFDRAARGDRPALRPRSRANHLRQRLGRAAGAAGAGFSASRRGRPLQPVRLPDLSDLHSRRGRDSGCRRRDGQNGERGRDSRESERPHEDRLSRQSEQSDRHLHSVLRGQAPARRACRRTRFW